MNLNQLNVFSAAHTRGIYQSCIQFGLIALLSLIVNIGHAEDTLSALMHRMQSDTAVRIAYRETRTLELMERPWQGSGYMYSRSPGLMIKEQLQPERVLMGIEGDRMIYFDPVNDVRHQGEMDQDSPLSLNVAVFKALISADEALLHRLYRVEFSSEAQGWVMTLKPKRDSESGFNIVISGPAGQQADSIKVTQADGDFSEFSLWQDAEGDEVNDTVNRLYQELLGE